LGMSTGSSLELETSPPPGRANVRVVRRERRMERRRRGKRILAGYGGC
jgi:hypothetical protein